MKYFIVILSVLAFVVIEKASHAAPLPGLSDLLPALIVQPPEEVFAPMGFDNNDNAQIVIGGNLTSTCYKAGPVRQRVDHDNKVIYIRNQVYFYSGCWCADVQVPYVNTVDLGVLGAGTYQVVIEKADGSFGKATTLPVAVATSRSPDDYLYAPVDDAHLVRNGGEVGLMLSGTFSNTCMDMQEVKLVYRPNHVIEVLPIASMGDQNCRHERRPFRTVATLKSGISGRALIHVRSLNGKSLNQLVDL